MKTVRFIVFMTILIVIFKSEQPFKNVNEIQEVPMPAAAASYETIGFPMYENNYFEVYGEYYVLPNVNNTYYMYPKSSSYTLCPEAEDYSYQQTDCSFTPVDGTTTVYNFICSEIGAYYIKVHGCHAEPYGYFTIICVPELPY